MTDHKTTSPDWASISHQNSATCRVKIRFVDETVKFHFLSIDNGRRFAERAQHRDDVLKVEFEELKGD